MSNNNRHGTTNSKALPLHYAELFRVNRLYKGGKTQLERMAKQETEQKIKPDYLHDGSYRLKQAHKHVDKLAEPNRSYVEEWERSLKLRGLKDRSLARRIFEICHCLRILGKDAKTCDKRDVENLILALNESDMAASSREISKLTLKSFFKSLYNISEKGVYPPLVAWIQVKRVQNTKTDADILTESEMIALIKAARSIRDKTILAILSLFGCRIGELLNLKWKDVQFSDTGIHWVSFSGKTGYRKCPFSNDSLVAPYLRDYYNQFKPDNLDEPLFKTRENYPLDYPNVKRLLKVVRERAIADGTLDRNKKTNPHAFRFAASTIWASTLSEQLLKRYMGWSADSRMASVYVKLSDNALAEGISKAVGKQIVEIKPKPQTKECERCKEINPITNVRCQRCSAALDKDAVVKEVYDKMQQQQEIDRLNKELMVIKDSFNFLINSMDDKTKARIKDLFKE